MYNKKEVKRISPHSSFFPKNQRGQGLSTNAIILIILGVIVLVMLVFGFIAGWDNIAPWIKPSNNVKTIVDACSIACSTNNVYDYCRVKRELNTEEKTETLKDVTCYYLSEEKSQYGIEKCSIDCDIILSDEINLDNAKTACPKENNRVIAGKLVQYLDTKNTLITHTCSAE